MDVADMEPVKRKHEIPAELEGCHTAIVDGYIIEGHVPADVIRKLLKERPDAVGLSVPGMPIGSPGMEMPGRHADPYSVLLFDENGKTIVYARR